MTQAILFNIIFKITLYNKTNSQYNQVLYIISKQILMAEQEKSLQIEVLQLQS